MRRTRSSRPDAPDIALCAGLKSSGSTWLYNAVIQMLGAAGGASSSARAKSGVLAFYAENIGSFPPGAELARHLVIKTHIPSPSLQFLARFARAATFVTVREPRDAIASLMQRFDHKFTNCLKEVSAGATRMVELKKSGGALILRYEDEFFDQPETLREVAAHLGIRVPATKLDKIFRSLTREEVRKKIDRLERRGTFGRSPDPDSFDPKTHWHPGHVGDAAVGKYAAILSSKEQQATLTELADYCAAFGYPGPHRKAIRRRRSA